MNASSQQWQNGFFNLCRWAGVSKGLTCLAIEFAKTESPGAFRGVENSAGMGLWLHGECALGLCLTHGLLYSPFRRGSWRTYAETECWAEAAAGWWRWRMAQGMSRTKLGCHRVRRSLQLNTKWLPSSWSSLSADWASWATSWWFWWSSEPNTWELPLTATWWVWLWQTSWCLWLQDCPISQKACIDLGCMAMWDVSASLTSST